MTLSLDPDGENQASRGPPCGDQDTYKKDGSSRRAPAPRPRTEVVGGDRVGNDVDIGRRVYDHGNVQRPGCGGGGETKLGDVRTGREAEAELRVGSGVAIMLGAALAHGARGDANECIVGRMLGGGPAG